MLRKLVARWWRFGAILLLCVAPLGQALASSFQGSAPDIPWANTPVSALKKVGQVSGLAEAEDIYNRNYDCTPETYRFELEPFGSMHEGCFAPTAFGQMDVTNSVVQGFGFSGAIPVRPFGNQVIIPMPRAASVATVSGASPMGAYLHLYTYFPSAVQLQYDLLLHPYLQLPQQANLILSGAAGQPLIINPQTIAFSSDGSWMVVESPWHSFLRINTATLEIVPFAPSFSPVLDYTMHNSQVAISNDGRYAAIASNEFKTFKVYDLATCNGTIAIDLQPLNCQSHDYQSYISSQVSNLTLVKHVRFMNDGLLNFHASHDGAMENYLLAPTDKITNLLAYLALGDSYTSGEGAFNYKVGTDTKNDMCHQSVNSYPYLLARDLFTSEGGRTVACSGAIVNDIASNNPAYPGQVQDGIKRKDRDNDEEILSNFTPGYLAQHEFTQKYQPRISTVSVGGNDIGFGDILATCVMPHFKNNTCYSSYEDREELAEVIDRTYNKWVDLYHQLQQESPSTHYFAIGYPHIAAPHGNCGANVHLNEEEVEFSEYLIDYLNSVIEQAANAAGVTYIDISHALDGHRLCESTNASVAMNGLTAGTDKFHALGKESYHPNALGHELIEQAILGKTNHFRELTPVTITSVPPHIDDDNPLVSAPKTSRKVRTLVPDSTISNDGAEQGSQLRISIDSLAHNLQPNSTYTIALGNTVLGTINSNSQGDVTGSITVPSDAPLGSQSLDISGSNIAGQPLDITKVINVGAVGQDSDADAIPDSQDSCPAIPNSEQDVDQDGIDDGCDGFIGLPPASNGSNSGLGSNSGASGSTTTSTSNLPNTSLTQKSAQHEQVSSPGPVAGAVLGANTHTPTAKQLASAISSRLARARENVLAIHWLPWGIDVVLVALLLSALSALFERLAKRAS